MSEPENYRLPSYDPKACCGDHCNLDTLRYPCWGQVTVVDEIDLGDDHVWAHACQANTDYYEGGTYHPPTDAADLAAWEKLKAEADG